MTIQERIYKLEKDVRTLNKRICCLNNIIDSVFILPILSSDFEPDGVTYINQSLDGKTYELFFNDLNRFLYNEVGNQEWNYIPGGGFEILMPGVDANSNDYHIYLLTKT